jgi:3-dehydroquinate synthetase
MTAPQVRRSPLPDGEGAIVTRTLRAGGREVPLLAGPGALARMPVALAKAGFEGRLFVVADEYAISLHGNRLDEVLPAAPRLCISGQEADKTLDNVARVWDWLVEQGAQRRESSATWSALRPRVICAASGW